MTFVYLRKNQLDIKFQSRNYLEKYLKYKNTKILKSRKFSY